MDRIGPGAVLPSDRVKMILRPVIFTRRVPPLHGGRQVPVAEFQNYFPYGLLIFPI